MKKNIRFVYNGEEIAVTAEREGSNIIIERDSKRYTVTLVEEHSAAPASVKAPPIIAAPARRPDGPVSPAAPEEAAPRPAAGGGDVPAPMTGVVKEIMVAVGDSVKEGEKILIMEAMKMDIDVTAVRGGRVSAILVKSSDNIKEGQPLIRIG